MTTTRRLSDIEFIGLTAMLFASIAFSVDTMLPGIGDIGGELSPANPNYAQFVVTSFILGMGLGTLVVGPISDTFGRKPVILTGAGLYLIACYVCYRASSLELLIAGRIAMGLAAAAPRAVGLAIVRDLYSGRVMAKIMSFAMMVFSLIPAVAPLAGSYIMLLGGWRDIFLGFMGFMTVTMFWLWVRQPETLPSKNRVPLRFRALTRGVAEILGNRTVVIASLTLSLSFALIFSSLVSIQPIYDITFGRGDEFPMWFALTSVLAMSASFINARLVERLGMRVLINAANIGQAVFSSVIALAFWLNLLPPPLTFPAFFLWTTSIFWMVGLTIGNLNALALEPMGHIAGLAASVVSSVATILSIPIAVAIGLAFDGTPVPIMAGLALNCIAAVALIVPA